MAPRSKLRVVQISDCHVAASPGVPYRGQNAAENLSSLLAPVRSWAPDLVLLTGDVSEDASEDSYRIVAGLLDEIPAPLYALPGNHDEPDTMRRFFAQGPWSGPLVIERGAWRIVLLDSTRSGEVSGFFSTAELRAFEATAREGDPCHLLVGLHHQPVATGSAWIDRYALQQAHEFLQTLEGLDRLRCVIWGHIHHDFRSWRDGVAMLGAPSTAVNSLPGMEQFTSDPKGPACRWLELAPDGAVRTGILYPE